MKKILNNDFVLYVLFAAIATVINVTVYMLSYKFIKIVLVSNILAYACSITVSFLANKYIVFKSKNGKVEQEIPKYLMVKLVAYFIDSLVLILCFKIIGLSNFVSKIISNASTTFSNFFLNKYMVFRKET